MSTPDNPDSISYSLKTTASDGSQDEAWLEIRGKGAVKHMQIDVHHAQPWMGPDELVRHLRGLADQIESRWSKAAARPNPESDEHQ